MLNYCVCGASAIVVRTHTHIISQLKKILFQDIYPLGSEYSDRLVTMGCV